MVVNEGYGRYLNLIERLDHFLTRVRRRYESEILCREGCADCCHQSLSLWAVEAYHLAQGWKGLPSGLAGRLQEQAAAVGWSRCPLLMDQGCALYAHRPILCRTYGYPFLSREEGGAGGPLVSYCPRNFQGWRKGDRLEGGYVLDLDALNRMLVGVNLLFLGQLGREAAQKALRIPISEILQGRDLGKDRPPP